MSNLKRFLALTIAIMMIVSGMALNVSAAKPSDVTDPDLIYAIDTLNKLGVIKGTAANEDGTFVFSGEDFVTREQFALFTARISTALPSLFEVDQGLEIEKPFTDLKDPTFYSAINHLNSEGIVLGVGDDKFDPSSNVTLQDAVTMLIRSLNYTGLIYPTGFMVKANDKMVALIGENADFPLSDVLPNQPITRNDMAKLLWNYLMTKKQELTMIYNPGKGEWEPRDTGKMVLTLFGFLAQQGYVTGVSGWSANINVPNGKDNDGNTVYKTLSGPALSPNQNTQTASNKNDIVITTYQQDYYYNNNNVQIFGVVPDSVKEVRTTKAGLNLTDEKYTDEYLLGLKVQIFEDRRVNPVVQINIPAKLIGEKYDVTAAGNDSKFENVDNDINKAIKKVNSLTLGVSDDKTLTYVQDASVRDILPWTNLYMFQRDSATMSSSSNFRQYLTDIKDVYDKDNDKWSTRKDGDLRIDEGNGAWKYGNKDAIGGTKEYFANLERDDYADDAIKTFARYIKADNKTHYVLEYVDNGMFQDANGYWINDFYYVFRPLEVAYYTKIQDDCMVFSKNVTGDEDKNNHALTNNWLGTWGVSFKGKALEDGLTVANDVKPGEAFLYAVYGGKLHIYEKLDKVATDRSTFANNNTVRFTDRTKFPDITFNNSTKWKAQGAFGGVVGRGITTNKLLNLFADSSGTTLFARDITPDERATFENSHYVVVANRNGNPTSTNIAEGGAIYSGYMYDVLDTVDNTYKYVQIVNIDGGVTAANSLVAGDVIRLVDSKVGGAVYLNAYTNGVKSNAAISEEKFANQTPAQKDKVYEYYFTQSGAVNLTNLNAAETAILIDGNVADPRSHVTRTRAELRSDTKVYVYVSGNNNGDPIRATNITGLRGALRSTACQDLTVVGKGASYPGNASFVFLTSTDVPSAISSGSYGAIVTDDANARFVVGDKTYYQYTARIAVNGKLTFMDVVVQDGARKDDFVKLSGKTVNEYAEAVIVSSLYNVDNDTGLVKRIANFAAEAVADGYAVADVDKYIARKSITNAVNENVPDSDDVKTYFGKIWGVGTSDVRYGSTNVLLGATHEDIFTFGSNEVRYSRLLGWYQNQWIDWNGSSAEGNGDIFWDKSYREIDPSSDNKKLFHNAYVVIYTVKGEVVFINVIEDFR